jgi:hypothetical protein
MEPRAERLRLYGEPSDATGIEWAWVDEQLAAAGTYWITARGDGHPHPRPVWGVWDVDTVHLSIGSSVIGRALARNRDATVHLDSGTDVVIVEARLIGSTDDADLLARYNGKYSWNYTSEQYGPLTTLAATTVMAWQSAGWAGRDGFQRSGRWRFAAADDT